MPPSAARAILRQAGPPGEGVSGAFFARQTWRGGAAVAGFTLASRVAGFGRDIVVAAVIGAGPVADAVVVALKLPNLFRRMFAEGAFNAAFLPAAATELRQGPAALRSLAGVAASLLALAAGAIVVLGEAFMPWLLRVLAPGLAATPARLALAVALARITLPYLWFVCLAALFAALLNAARRFAVAAAMPVMFNLVCIAALLGLRRAVPGAALAFAIGVPLAGLAQCAVLGVVCARRGLFAGFARPALPPAVRLVLARMGPGLAGAGIAQLNTAVGIAVASLLPAGSLAVLYYADRLAQLPLGLAAGALATVLLPALAHHHAAGTREAARRQLAEALVAALAIAVPAATALALLAHPLIGVLFGRGAFGPQAVARAAAALRLYALAIPFAAAAKIFAPSCFARGDTATPAIAGGLAIAINLGLGLALLHGLGVLAPPAAASAAAFANAAVLAIVLWRRGDIGAASLPWRTLAAILTASATMGVALALLAPRLAPVLGRPGAMRWAILVAVVFVGIGLYAAVLAMIGGGVTLRNFRARPNHPTSSPEDSAQR